jgi:type IV pilus assembly protein PilC
MHMILQSGISLLEGIPLLREQSGSATLKQGLIQIEKHMENGMNFADACHEVSDNVFPAYLKSMIAIGEASGSTDIVFERLSDYYGKENRMRRKVRNALTYPVILTLLMVAMVFLLLTKVLPMFGDIMSTMGGGDVPALTSALLGFSGFVSRHWLVIGLGLILLIAGLVYFVRSSAGRPLINRWQLSLPISRPVYTRIITARFARSMAILLKSGVTVMGALAMMDHLLGNLEAEKRLMVLRGQVDGGAPLVEEMARMDIFPPLFMRLVMVGQTTGFLDDMMYKAAEIFDEEVDEALERMANMIEPVIIIILSVIIGVILLSIMLPMISIMNSIG